MLQIVLQILVNELEFSLSAVHPDNAPVRVKRGDPSQGMLSIPCTFIVKKSVRPLLILVCNHLRFLVPLKPGLVLLVKSPALAFERFSCEILLVGALSIVEDVEKSVCIDPARLIQ